MNPGDTIGHYRILESLGRGGMGEVFAAEDTRLHRRVALKMLPQVFSADPDYRLRFEREAQAIAALSHPNIVTIHSVEEHEGRLFLTMELVDGKPLSEQIPRGGMPLEKLLRVGIEIADAIAAAQERGITHRDLKPANVMIASNGRAKVLDFGLAKLKDAGAAPGGRPDDDMTRMAVSEITGEGKIIGTVAYMSPEQAEGKAVDSRSDIFSLGVLLHEMATGERPFKGDSNVSILSAILKDTPPPVTDANPNLPPDLARIIRRCLAKDPTRRYQTAADLRNELEDLKQDTASGVMSAVRPAPAAPSRAAGVARWVAIVAASLGIAALAVFLVRRAREPDVPPAAAFAIDRMSRLTTTGSARLAAISPDGKYVVHVKLEEEGTSLWTRQTATTSDVRIVPPGEVRFDGLAFSPDGNYVYYNAYPGTRGVASLFRVPVLGGTSAKLIEDVDSPVTFSPDQKRLAFMRGVMARGTTELIVADSDGGNARVLATAPPPDKFQSEGLSWSPDGGTILATATSTRPGAANLIYAVNAQTGAMQIVGEPWAFTRDVAWLPDGRAFVATAVDFSGLSAPQIWSVSYPSGGRSRVTTDLNAYLGASVSADGKSLATVQIETIAAVYVSDGKGGAPRKITGGPGRADGLGGLAWMPDGRIVYTSTASGLMQLWIADADGKNARQITSLSAPASFPWGAPDGKWIYFTSYTKEQGSALFRVSPDGTGIQQLTNDGDARDAVISPDGTTLYYTSQNTGLARLMKVSAAGGTGEALLSSFFRVRDISPDGSRLIGTTWSEEHRRAVLSIFTIADRRMELRPELSVSSLFTPDGGIASAQRIRGKTVVSIHPPGGGPARELDAPDSMDIFSAAIARDGRIAFAAGESTSDVVLIQSK